MHFSTASIALIAGILFQQANANFDVYRTEWNSILGDQAIVWQFFEAAPSCDEAIHTAVWEQRSDVSGSKLGVRCAGSGCAAQAPPENIDQLEIHTSNNPLYHWTLYKDRGRTMVGLDGNSYGNCIVFPNGDYNCNQGGLGINGRRKFRCLTQFTAQNLNANARVATTLGDQLDAEAAEAQVNATAIAFAA